MSIERVSSLKGLLCAAVIDAVTGAVVESVGGMGDDELASRAATIRRRCSALLEVCGHADDLVFSGAGDHHLVVFGGTGAHLFYVSVTQEDSNLAMTRFALESLAKEYESA